ncbi:MAG TPA: LptF/LptG family permease, partial [Alphaproteobacteria bacterium]|nr:LptF/LptG family permease [Alphaproteobacteria bacterium]
REAGERYVWELLRPSDQPDDLKNRDKFLAEAHQRLVLPFFAPALVAIALGALLSGEFNRRGQWRRLMVAVIAGVLFEALGLGLQNATAKLPALSPLMYLNPAAAIALGLLAMGRRRPLGLLPRPWRTAQP